MLPSEENKRNEDEQRTKSGSVKSSPVVFRLKTRLANPKYVKALYAQKPEAVVKVISYARGHRVKIMMDYVARTDKDEKEPVEVENDMGAALKGEKDINQAFEAWKKDFDRAKPGAKQKSRHAVHVMLSAACNSKTKDALKALNAAREVIREQIGNNGYEFISALHRDSDHAHVHFIIKCKNREPGKPKLRINPTDILKIRTAFADKLTELGIDHVATLRRDRPNIVERVKNGVEKLNKKESQYQRAMRRTAPSIDAFEYRKAISSTIIKLRDQVKKETEPRSEKRRELLGALRSLERKVKKSRHSIDAEIAATINKFEKESARYGNQVDRLKNPDPKIKAPITKKQIKELGQRISESIETARKEIKAADISPQEKKDALFVLSQHERAINKSMGKPKDLDAFKPTLIDALTGLDKQVAEFKKLHKALPASALEQLRRRRQIDKMSAEIAKGIDQARKEIRKSGASPAGIKDALRQLRQHEKAIKPAMQPKRGR